MIYDTIENLTKYCSVHPFFKDVAVFISKNDLAKYQPGKISVSDKVYGTVDIYETKRVEDKFIECHRKYIDIQVIIDGTEQIGIANKSDCEVLENYSEEKDFEKLTGKFDLITLKKGSFAIFFPQDGHIPGLTLTGREKSAVKKIVFKVPV